MEGTKKWPELSSVYLKRSDINGQNVNDDTRVKRAVFIGENAIVVLNYSFVH